MGLGAGGGGAGAGVTNGPEIIIPQGPTNDPRVLVRSLTDKEAVFHLTGVEMGYANSLRRVMMADVPTVGESSEMGTDLRFGEECYCFWSMGVWTGDVEEEGGTIYGSGFRFLGFGLSAARDGCGGRGSKGRGEKWNARTRIRVALGIICQV